MIVSEILIFIVGFIAGALLVWLISLRHRKDAGMLARELLIQTQDEKARELERVITNVKEAFGSLSMETLSKTTGEFIKLADQKFGEQSRANQTVMDNKKALIDQTLTQMKGELEKVHTQIET